jgi:peptide/nickel transport system ATP-binding protein
MIASHQHPASACPYAARCGQAQTLCDLQAPELKLMREGHQVACHFAATGLANA